MTRAIMRKARLAWGRRAKPGRAAGAVPAPAPTFPADGSIEDWARLGGGLTAPYLDARCGPAGSGAGDGGMRYPARVMSPSP